MTNCIHVDKKGSDCGLGNVESPFLTIDKAASVAQPGDSIIVHEGIYHEEITHINTGLSESRRISFEAAQDEQVIIKGSEEITGWQQIDGSIWKVEIDNNIFKDFNPFATKLFGDWLAVDNDKSLGQVYLNNQSLFEVSEYEQLADPKLVEETLDHWTNKQVTYDYKDQSIYVWYAKLENDITTIYVNFHDYNPNNEVTEINVRKSAFRPFKMHTNYITIRNFEIANVATQWSPPTAAQTGMIDTHWNKVCYFR